MIFLEALSAMVVFFPIANTAVAVVLTLICLALSIVRPEIGIAILAGELLIGSKGGLFRIGADAQNNGGVPIRILLFCAFILGWLIWSVRTGSWKKWSTLLCDRWIYGVLALVLGWAFVNGLMHHQSFVFADANSWGMWLLLLPILHIVSLKEKELKNSVFPTIFAGLCWLPIKTLFLFYLFSHSFSPQFLEQVYLWIRRTGVGEITRASGSVFRIFIQSHIYALGVIFVLWCKQVRVPKLTRAEWVLLILSLAEILVSLSRSFWLGLGAGGVVLFAWFVIANRMSWKRTILTGLVSSIAAVMLVAGLLWFPLPPSDGSLAALIRTRIDAGEDAATSRWQLLPILWSGVRRAPIEGSGFGATITYQSRDPRIVQATGGEYTTYAFEWGWLDLWYKLGLLGLVLVLAILFRLGYGFWRLRPQDWQTWAIIVGLVSLATVHFFTPYLNHPLGFGILIALEAGLFVAPIASRSRE